ncbi:MAG: peptidoglycan-binding domain-containing protein [Acidimicrobiia bacterium]
MKRTARAVLGVAAAALLFVGGWWAALVVLEPPADPLTDADQTLFTVDEGTVGRSLRFASVAEWTFQDLARNASSGIVTSIDVAQGATISAGQVLYTVNLRPVMAAEGAIPAFRDLALRVEGEDVAQLQNLLAQLGLYQGEADGEFDSSTRSAVRAWQESLGVADDGVVRVGDIVFVPELPARVVLSEDVKVGSTLAGGEQVLRRVSEEVRFWIPLSPEQRSLVPLSADVLVTHGQAVWQAVVVEAVENEAQGELLLVLEAPNGGSVCGSECGEVSLEGQTSFPSEIVVVPETAGPVVPVAAIKTLPDGATVVTAHDGSQIQVRILAAADGLAVVDGLAVGDVIMLPVDSDEP